MADARSYKFLIAIDGSESGNRATEYVARQASKLRPCEVHLVTVRPARILELLTDAQRDLVLNAADETDGSRQMLDSAGIAYRFHAQLGDPVREIIALVNKLACDEIVLGSRGMSTIDGLVVGSVAYKIVHEAPVPVSVVPNAHTAAQRDVKDGEGAHRILLPVDGSALAARAVKYVQALRDARTAVEVRLLNVQLPILSGNVRRFVSQDTIENYWRGESEAALQGATQALQDAGMKFESKMSIGHASETIAKEANQWGATRIVMGTRGLGALASVVVGSTALQVVHLSEIPVTLVK
jgi:nucleotide-binding universal stress UspA family protein